MTSAADRTAPLPAPVPALFPGSTERLATERWLTEALEEARRRIHEGAVVPSIDMMAFRRELDALDFEQPRPLAELLRFALAGLSEGIVQMGNPRYFGLFNPAPSFPAQCADRLAGLFNPQLASSGSSPVPVEIERHVIRAMAARAGLGAGAGGHFATGGSEANFTGMLCALTAAHAGFASDGSRAFAGPPLVYASSECHVAWLKNAHQAGIGRTGLRFVPTDGGGRLDPHALGRLIAEDRARGAVPVMLVATAGTTGAGMIDPLAACVDVAAAHGLWLHVDAAWGGAALSSNRLRGLLAGIERADSITIDAHKWFATTMGCAMFLTPHAQRLSEVFHASTSFMPSSVAGVDPYLNTVQWSRRFLGLRLFLSLAAAGWAGMGAHVDRSVAVTALIEQRLVAAGWTVVNASPLAVLALLPPPGLGEVRELVRRVVAAGRAWVAPARFEGRDVIRICVTSGETSLADVETLLEALGAGAAS